MLTQACCVYWQKDAALQTQQQRLEHRDGEVLGLEIQLSEKCAELQTLQDRAQAQGVALQEERARERAREQEEIDKRAALQNEAGSLQEQAETLAAQMHEKNHELQTLQHQYEALQHKHGALQQLLQDGASSQVRLEYCV